MKLSDLLTSIAEISVDYQIEGLRLDSRKIKSGDVFIALNGALQHGLNHARQALANGAVAVIYDPQGVHDASLIKDDFIAISNLSRHLGEIAARFYGHPSRQIDVIGITGTNGKTTCSQLLAQTLKDCGVIGTLGWGRAGRLQATLNTTPDALDVQYMLRALAEDGQKAVAMEVSSHGLEQGRVNAVEFTGAVFTNLSRDHLDYHGTMEAYLQAKLGLFKNPALAFAVVNLDDASNRDVLETLHQRVKRWGFSTLDAQTDGVECVTASRIEYSASGICFDVHWSGKTAHATTSVMGAVNLQNVLTVLCVLLAMDRPFEAAVAQLSHLKAVSGRMESFGGTGKPAVIVDYAHTPDALEKVLIAAKGQGELWAVFGCGGDRDKGKRPLMGRIAETYADHVLVTDDNPRSEASETIIQDILSGCLSNKINVINDRNTAITTAIQQANQDDCVVVAGKGHENYQEIKGVKFPFSDQAVVQQALAAWSPKP
ncbi:MAG: UDP-N-acetylmuramoyl-L-alanyl-D-glutamate--2,6-diaminopimelate ligase [Methylomonas sp.]|jgi:UDP-N-acetylmuramoyl-L-alanyl-D-glutamate--2,6-diaminopimelate ligase|uniref:UDP-N-acetylmuramoyl-L-alanyl-D-glutamate--2, 6-diaminopimelate ligase n=1 Tax=Methylomonas sp. TaxID=418 RepID=UPI0025D35FD1|nr:UDP-N-acetylmuramoyl-L-alanyl-D-glutamate--2,6-diaminopimelate ligase [Methylomonas sp.]MCK9607733.1 UDP-N-acetylmuramoyl-L-alanyl-D-glutamate--2,6-diaminopimelate ligase [Methylomonas sp.]